MSNSDPTGALLLGFGGGLFSFFRGFKVYRECRVVEDTPQIPIRSIPMGLVNIHGSAVGESPMPSPVSRTPCFFYKVIIEKWEHDQRSSGWKHLRTDMDGSLFRIADGTGMVLVDAHGAELDLTQICAHEVSCASNNSFQAGAATDDELLRYVTEAQMHGFTSFLARRVAAVHPLGDAQKEQARQGLIAALEHPLDSSGVSPEMMAFMSGIMKTRLASGASGDPRQQQVQRAMLDVFQFPIGSPEFMEKARAAFAQFPEAHDAEEKFNSWVETIRQKQDQPHGLFSPASGRYRFTEYCIVPGQEYNITGTCVENPAGKDGQNMNLITKGVNEPTYLISDKPLRTVESGLRKKALLMIGGGAAAAVICLGFLLARFGLF